MTEEAQLNQELQDSERINIDRVSTNSSIENVEAQLQELNNKPWLIKFSDVLEQEFKKYLNLNYIQSDAHLLVVGHLIFFSFIWVDLVIFPTKATELVLVRTASSVLTLFIVYLAFFKRWGAWGRNAMLVTAATGITGACAIFISSLLLPNPYNVMYMVGIMPLFAGITASLRNNTRLVAFISGIVSVLFALTAIANVMFGVKHELAYVQQILTLVAPMLVVFFFGTCLISTYLTFSIERSFRTQWLLMVLRDLDADRLENLTQRFKNLSHIDDLTRIANRRQLVNRVSRYLSDEKNLGEKASFIMMDVDHFKAYNDHYGHLQGDICLQSLAYCLADSCQRLGDIAARFGGEEFVAFLPKTDAQQALVVAHRVHEALMRLNLPHVYGIGNKVSASFGVVTITVDNQQSFESIVHKADLALYAAKDQGRNRVVAYTPEMSNHEAT